MMMTRRLLVRMILPDDEEVLPNDEEVLPNEERGITQ